MARTIIAGMFLLAFLSLAAAQNLNEDLLTATRKGDLEKVKTLLAQGADVNAKSPYGATPLFFACDRSNVEMVKLLLEKGADPNVKDTFYGASPLNWALGKGSPEIIKMLIEHGAKEKNEALSFGVNGSHLAVVQAVLQKGGIEQVVLNKSLRVAQTKDAKEIADALAKAGAKEVPEFKVTPEQLAMYEGSFKSTQVSIVFKVKDGKLIGTANGSDNTMVPVSQHVFDIEQATGITVTFTLEGDKVTGLDLKTPNGAFNLKKESDK
jgi:hypothetical protein